MTPFTAFTCSQPFQTSLFNTANVTSTCPSETRTLNTLRMVASEIPKIKEPNYALQVRPIGPSGLTISEVTLGSETWGIQNNMEQAYAQLDIAYERGVVGIDTAELYPVPPNADTYGNTERLIGSWIKKKGGQSFREKLVIFSKVAGGSTCRPAFPYIRGTHRKVDRTSIRRAIDGTLQRLGTDYIDLYQIHWPDRYVPLFGATKYDPSLERPAVSFEEQVETMAELIKEGKIRNYGISNESPWGVAQFDAVARVKGLPRPVSVQNCYNLVLRDFEGHMAEACSPINANLPLLAYGSLAGGVLTGKYLSGKRPKGSRFVRFPDYQLRFQKDLVQGATFRYSRIAKEAGLSMTQLALAWCKSRHFVASTIISATSVEQLEENLDAFSVELDESVLSEIEKIYAIYRDPAQSS